MCLARVYGCKNNEEGPMIADAIANIIPEGDSIRLIDIFGDEIVVEGHLINMDLERNMVRIELTK